MKTTMEGLFDSLAPNWGEGNEKDLEWIRKRLIDLGIKPGKRVMDLACGTGVISFLLHEITGEEVTAIDLSSEMIKIAKEKNHGKSGVNFLKRDFLDYEGAGFDAVVCFDAYPHFLDRNHLKKKIRDVLNRNGLFIVLHDLSREELDECHAGEGMSSMSRHLESPSEEAAFYGDSFVMAEAGEDDHSYFFVLRKVC